MYAQTRGDILYPNGSFQYRQYSPKGAMLLNILIVVSSLALFVYWFRYTCLLLLSMRPARDYAGAVAEVNFMCFPEVRRELAFAAGLSDPDALRRLDALSQALDRDYALLTSWMRHGAEFRMRDRQIERFMLLFDYRVMKVIYTVSRRRSIESGRKALDEMAAIITHIAGMMGQCVACSLY